MILGMSRATTFAACALCCVLPACFEGRFLDGLPCTQDSDCGPQLGCSNGTCGGFECPVELVAGACPCPGPANHVCTELTRASANEIDVVFIVDDTGSTDQQRLIELAPALLSTLDAKLADYRIAITTTDNGNPWCVGTTPTFGKFVFSSCRQRLDDFIYAGQVDSTAVCLDACEHESISTVPTLVAGTSAPRPWLEASPAGTNLAEGIGVAEALACLLPQGTIGCGFEQPLESLRLALERSESPAEGNFGFLRSTAHLVIVIVTDEVDCSYSPNWASIFDADSTKSFWTNPQSQFPTSGVCWNAGVQCIGDGTPYDSCVAAGFDANGEVTSDSNLAVLHPVARYIETLDAIAAAKRARDDSLEVVVTLIAGVPQGHAGGPLTYSSVEQSDPEFHEEFGIGPGCSRNDGSQAIPPVRMLDFAAAFRPESQSNNVFSICNETFDGAFVAIDDTLESTLPSQCMQACVADQLDATPGVQPECALAHHVEGVSVEIPHCELDADSQPILGELELCYYSRAGAGVAAQCIEQGWNMQFGFRKAKGIELPETIFASCASSSDPATDCPIP
jgi:hypothetical protein